MGEMPGFTQLTTQELDALVTYLITADRAPGGGRGGPAPTFPPGPVVEVGPITPFQREAGRGPALPGYPEGIGPYSQLQMNGYGQEWNWIKPPYTTLSAYDLNKGTIKWQIGLGDDYRVTSKGGPKGTGAMDGLKDAPVSTSTGLVFIASSDHRLHIYDADTGKQLREINLGAASSGSPSMYEYQGRQYLIVSASQAGGYQGGLAVAADPNQKGPVGLTAFALRQPAVTPKK